MFLSESSATNEMKIRLPEALMSEIERVAEQDKVTRNELIYRATKRIFVNVIFDKIVNR